MKSKSFVIKFLINLTVCFIVIVIGVLVIQKWLMRYTEHGIEVKVPNLSGLYVEEASILLHGIGLKIEVIDSTFSKQFPLNTIVEQIPISNSNVKHGRIVYVVLNAKHRPMVKLPNLLNLSYRQAISVLHSINLEVKKIHYTPSIYRNLVLGVMKDTVTLSQGDMLEEGSGIILLVGIGNEKHLVPMPNLIGRSLKDVKVILLQHFLSIDSCSYDELDELNTENSFVVYKQYPNTGNPIAEGNGVKIWLSNDTTKLPPVQNIKREESEVNEENEDIDKFF